MQNFYKYIRAEYLCAYSFLFLIHQCHSAYKNTFLIYALNIFRYANEVMFSGSDISYVYLSREQSLSESKLIATYENHHIRPLFNYLPFFGRPHITLTAAVNRSSMCFEVLPLVFDAVIRSIDIKLFMLS